MAAPVFELRFTDGHVDRGPGGEMIGVARCLLHALEDRARRLGYTIARLDTGPRQGGAQHLYQSEGYVEVPNFNGNPIASFFGEKRLV